MCTIANTPRLPEHCIEYVKVIQWPKENPFDCPIDGDDPQHISWIYEKSNERAIHFGIQGLTYRLVQGVVKNIIPAVASTNAVIAAICCTEVFKLATSCSASLNNYMVNILSNYYFLNKENNKNRSYEYTNALGQNPSKILSQYAGTLIAFSEFSVVSYKPLTMRSNIKRIAL